MNRQLRRNLFDMFDAFLYNPLTPFFKGELDQLLHYLKSGKLYFYRHYAACLVFRENNNTGKDTCATW